MTALWEFPGGIQPPRHKHRSTRAPIAPLPLPETLVIPLLQYDGSFAQPLVQPGDPVLKGQLIARGSGPAGRPFHAGTSGSVTGIGAHPLPHPSGMAGLCIRIAPDGRNTPSPNSPCRDYRSLDRQALIARIRDAGISGLGGADFPAANKLERAGAPVQTLIINGAECEPYITADDMLMRERAEDILAGAEMLHWLLEAKTCLIAVEDDKPEALRALRDLRGDSPVEVVAIPARYPSGGEHQLIRILTGQSLPADALPVEHGIVCQNVATVAAIRQAVVQGEPSTSRIITVTGEAVRRPGNYEVTFGTPIRFVLEQAGADWGQVARLIIGGPLMGFPLTDPDAPVTGRTNCVIAATDDEMPDPGPERACIRCGFCADACPAGLLPQQILWDAKNGELRQARSHYLFDCIECGACDYVCPSAIPLVQYFQHAKGTIRQRQEERDNAQRARQRFENRNRRIERLRAEREARRQARIAAIAERRSAEASAQAKREARAAAVREAVKRKQTRQAATAKPNVSQEALNTNLRQGHDTVARRRHKPAGDRKNPDGEQS